MAEYRTDIHHQVWEEAIVLFATFSRFEHAMKRSGFLNSLVLNAKAEANWDTFAQKLGATFLNQCKSTPMLDAFFKSPPRLLKVSDTHAKALKWEVGRIPDTPQALLLCVRDVRNSLFHGEKSIGRKRDHQLVMQAQDILDIAFESAAKSDEQQLKDFVEKFRYY